MNTRNVTIASIVSLVLGGCASMSPEQQAYNSCVDPYNDKFRTLSGNRAMVGGGSMSGGSCYWSWNAGSRDVALEQALESCQENFSKCFVFADGSGTSEWARAISDNGGTVPGLFTDGEISAGLSAFATGAAVGLSAYGGSQGIPAYSMTPSMYGGFGSSASPSAFPSETAGGWGGGGASVPTGSGSPSGGAAGCAAKEEALRRKVERISAEVRNAGGNYGICQSARSLESVLIDQINLIRSCPMSDPSGGQQAESMRALEQTREVQRAACVS